MVRRPTPPPAPRSKPAAFVAIDAGTPAASVLAAALDQLDAACARHGAFGALVDVRSTPTSEGSSPGRVEQVRRLRRLRPRLRERCVGIAFVTAPDEAAEVLPKRLRAARLMVGCPVDTFGSVEDAQDWLANRGVSLEGEVG